MKWAALYRSTGERSGSALTRGTASQRRHDRTRRSNWWGVTSKTLDKATALLPALLNERLPELGIDFALIYPNVSTVILL